MNTGPVSPRTHYARIVATVGLAVALQCSTDGDASNPSQSDSTDPQTVIETVHFTVSSVTGPGIYLSPRKKEITDNIARFVVRGKDLPPSRSLSIVLSGAQVSSADHLLGSSTNVVFLHEDSTINLAVGPNAPAITGDLSLFEIVVKVGTGSDTSWINLVECVIRDEMHDDVALKTVRGGIVVR